MAERFDDEKLSFIPLLGYGTPLVKAARDACTVVVEALETTFKNMLCYSNLC